MEGLLHSSGFMRLEGILTAQRRAKKSPDNIFVTFVNIVSPMVERKRVISTAPGEESL